jgi:hypothetical protein
VWIAVPSIVHFGIVVCKSLGRRCGTIRACASLVSCTLESLLCRHMSKCAVREAVVVLVRMLLCLENQIKLMPCCNDTIEPKYAVENS